MKGQPIKALSLWQPWASLVAAGAKRFETRAWYTHHRGLLAIHAGLTREGWGTAPRAALVRLRDLAYPPPPEYAAQRPIPELPRPDDFAHGCLVALVELVDCHPITPELLDIVTERELARGRREGGELDLGHWREGRFAWELRRIARIQPPVACTGLQGLFDVSLEELGLKLPPAEPSEPDACPGVVVMVAKTKKQKSPPPVSQLDEIQREESKPSADGSARAAHTLEVEMVPIAELDLAFGNLRAPSANGLADLAHSIEQHGVLHPVLARRRGNGLQLIAGFRRVAAAKQAGLASIPVRALELTDSQASALQLVENDQREDVDPFRAADAIASLRAQGLATRDIARELGRSESFVVRREALEGISGRLRELLEKQPQRWPIGHLELLARLAPESQALLIEDDDLLELASKALSRPASRYDSIPTLGALELRLSEYLHELAHAPWPLDDATLLPEAGACTACIYNSARTPGLFEDAVQEGSDARAHCRKVTCWDAKREALTARKVAELKAEHGKKAVRVSEEYYPPKGALGAGKWEKVKKTDKDAQPAVIVDGKKAGEVTWVKPIGRVPSDEPKEKPKSEKPKGPPTLKQLERELAKAREEVAKRRSACTVEGLSERIDEFVPTGSTKSKVKDVARVQAAGELLVRIAERRGESVDATLLRFAILQDKAMRGDIGEGREGMRGVFEAPVLAPFFTEILSDLRPFSPKDVGDARWLCSELFGPDEWGKLEAAAEKKIPVPKTLTQLEKSVSEFAERETKAPKKVPAGGRPFRL